MNNFIRLLMSVTQPFYMTDTVVSGGGGGDGGGDGGGGGDQFDPAAARTFLSDFVDPASIKDAKDEDIKTLHGKFTAALDKHRPAKKGDDQPWGENWREVIGNKDEKEVNRLKRFQNPGDMWKSYRELEKTLTGGGYVKPLEKDASEEDVKAYRTKMGVPEKPDGYLGTKEFKDLKVGDTDKAAIEAYLKDVAHKNHLSPAVAREGVNWLQQQAEARAEQRHAADETGKRTTEDALRGEWGREYRGNITAIENLLGRLPQAFREQLVEARLPDGTALFNSQDALKWLAALENELNPASRILPSGGGSDLQSIDGRIKEIEGVMKSNRAKYNADDGMQSELRQLYAAREKMKQKAA